MITCKEYTEIRKGELTKYIKDRQLRPCLVVIQVGDRPESNSYIRGKVKDCEEVGINCQVTKLAEETDEKSLLGLIGKLNAQDDVHGIIVQLPLPDHINVKKIQEAINPAKDVDGFNRMSQFEPCTPLGVINYLKYIGYEFEGKAALVIGRSDIVGKPLARMLTDLDCTVTLAHSKTPYIKRILNSDIIDITFTCINKIGYYDSSYTFTPYIIDIGLGADETGKLCGNLSRENADWHKKLRSRRGLCISGVGGVGLLTRLSLLENTVKAAELAMEHKEDLNA